MIPIPKDPIETGPIEMGPIAMDPIAVGHWRGKTLTSVNETFPK